MKKSTVILSVVVVLALLVFLIVWLKPDGDSQSAQELQADTANQSQTTDEELEANESVSDSAAAAGQFTTGLESLPASLRDTQVDGEIIIDDNQQLVVTEGLRRLFDYFLSAAGEESEETLSARAEAYIRHHTREPAASQAVDILYAYMDYLKSLSSLQDQYGNLQMQATKSGKMDLNMVAQRTQDMKQLRQQYFDDETIEAFFGSEDAYNDYTIAMMEIEQNSTLSEEQKEAMRADYVSRMPEGDIKAHIESQANLGELMSRTEAMKQQGASEAELFNMRAELVGEAAAARLAQVDKQDADFAQRYAQYDSQRQAIIQQYGDSSQAQTQISQLQQSLFNDSEIRRLEGYAQVHQGQWASSGKIAYKGLQ